MVEGPESSFLHSQRAEKHRQCTVPLFAFLYLIWRSQSQSQLGTFVSRACLPRQAGKQSLLECVSPTYLLPMYLPTQKLKTTWERGSWSRSLICSYCSIVFKFKYLKELSCFETFSCSFWNLKWRSFQYSVSCKRKLTKIYILYHAYLALSKQEHKENIYECHINSGDNQKCVYSLCALVLQSWDLSWSSRPAAV